MPISNTGISDNAGAVALLAQAESAQTKANSNSGIAQALQYLKSVTFSPEFMAYKPSWDGVCNHLSDLLDLHESLKSSDKPVAEQLPDYIKSGRFIRLTLRSLEAYGAEHLFFLPETRKEITANTTRIAVETALQMSMQLPDAIDPETRDRLLTNIRSEQFREFKS